MIPIVRFVPVLCILATFPALGQVENATEARSPEAAVLDAQRAPGNLLRTVPIIQPPRLHASEQALDDGPPVPLTVPLGSQPEIHPRPQVVRLVTPAAAPARLAPVVVAPQASAYDRIAALSAAPVDRAPGGVPRGGEASASALAGGLDAAVASLRLYWRQIGLVSAIGLTAGLLLWRLGERGRHAEQELVLGGSGSEAFGALEEDTVEAGEAEFALTPTEPAPDTVAYAATAIRKASDDDRFALCTDQLVLDIALPEPAIGHMRPHATLREAIEAMKADMARTREAVQA